MKNEEISEEEHVSAHQKKLLFIGGCPRSGTSALVQTLNAHNEILVGHERFFHLWRKGLLTPQHFGESRFLNVDEGDTFYDVEKVIPTAFSAQRYPKARFIGDKYPKIYECYDLISEGFPEAHLLYILRNPFSVAESYQVRYEKEKDWAQDFRQSIKHWNQSLSKTLAFLRVNSNVTVVNYETVFSSIELIDLVFLSLGLDPENSDRKKLKEIINEFNSLSGKLVPRREEIRHWVSCNADFISYQMLRQYAIDVAPCA